MNQNKKQLLIFIGPPGTGKSTQAIIFAEDYDYCSLETSRVIEDNIKNGDPEDKDLLKAKEVFSAGGIVDSDLVFSWMIEKIKVLAAEDKSIVLHGSPRRVVEAEREMPFFEDWYGKQNIDVVNIDISEEEAVKRNSFRRICKANRHPIPNLPEYESIKQCPKDGSELETRVLDDEDTIRTRYRTYLEETKPVLDFFVANGYKVIKIDGRGTILDVHQRILDAVAGRAVRDKNSHKNL